jgi:hypothetical protein
MAGQMSFEAFRAAEQPPAAVGPALLALWHDAHGDWERAHALAQEDPGRDGAWVHAHLHRKEGDEMNAGYWYARAGRPAATGDLGAEWEVIARELLSRTERC